MTLKDLEKEYDQLQKKYGAKELDSIYHGGCVDNPDICFVFMNPTGRNIAANKSWKGLKAPWIGTKNIWDLFYSTNLLDKEIYQKIRNINGKDYHFFPVFYPVGNGRFNIDKSIEDILWIKENLRQTTN